MPKEQTYLLNWFKWNQSAVKRIMSTANNTVVNVIMVDEKLWQTSLTLILKELIEFNVYVYYELAYMYLHINTSL